ncbi:unnamed protein product [Musa acuminata subsp. malaccensis]|uniref:(wild Malaysian banana) hypothetical protein n=1 Tax=Musa acuminata subsp. malaccensis TaxID=214687 RepID=A0A804ISA0_MUSAM|nr:unnamed protein product [Musa acuminata subsp. malaccensis]
MGICQDRPDIVFSPFFPWVCQQTTMIPRQATKFTRAVAGLNVARTIIEATAAVIILDKKGSEKSILIFYLGSGTISVSILTIVNENFMVLAANGDTYLVGKDFGQQMMEIFIKSI